MKTADLHPSAICKLCGGYITGRNRYGICGKGPKCRAQYSRLYNLDRGHPDGAHARRQAEKSGMSQPIGLQVLIDIFSLVPGIEPDEVLAIASDCPKAERRRIFIDWLTTHAHFWTTVEQAEKAAERCCTGAPGWLKAAVP
jgi:hypothetical protein